MRSHRAPAFLRIRRIRILGEEAMDFLQTVNSGHASTPADVIGRLETMAMYGGLNLPSAEIRRQISSGLDLIVQHEQLANR